MENNEQDAPTQSDVINDLINAHKALTNTVNAHVELTTTLDKVVKKHDQYNCIIQSKTIAITDAQGDRIDTLYIYMKGLFIINICIVVLILWRMV